MRLAQHKVWGLPLLEVAAPIVFLALPSASWQRGAFCAVISLLFFFPLLNQLNLRVGLVVDALLCAAALYFYLHYSRPMHGDPILSPTGVLGLLAPYGAMLAAISSACRRLGAFFTKAQPTGIPLTMLWNILAVVVAALCGIWILFALPMISSVFQEEGPNVIQPAGIFTLLCPIIAVILLARQRD